MEKISDLKPLQLKAIDRWIKAKDDLKIALKEYNDASVLVQRLLGETEVKLKSGKIFKVSRHGRDPVKWARVWEEFDHLFGPFIIMTQYAGEYARARLKAVQKWTGEKKDVWKIGFKK